MKPASKFVRLILAGIFDRYPGLQVILGHWGEVVLFYLERLVLTTYPYQYRPGHRVESWSKSQSPERVTGSAHRG